MLSESRLLEAVIGLSKANAELGMALVEKMTSEEAPEAQPPCQSELSHLDDGTANALRVIARYVDDDVRGNLADILNEIFPDWSDPEIEITDEERALVRSFIKQLRGVG